MAKTDVVVVGAGISGLSCARLLAKEGLNVVVLEARDRVGGRLYTTHDPSFNYIDVGGSYVGPTQNRILRLAKELGVKTYKMYIDGDSIHVKRKGQVVRYTGFSPTWNPLVSMDMVNFMRRINEMGEEIPVKAPWSAPHAKEWDATTAEEWLKNNYLWETSRDFIRTFVRINLTVEPSEISLLFLLWYVKNCNGSYRMQEVENGGQERKFVGGSQQISIKMAEQLGERVRLNSAVKSVRQSDSGVTIETLTGDRYEASYMIMATPPHLQASVHFDPPFNPTRTQLIQRLPMGRCIKSTTVFKKAYWRMNGLNALSYFDGDVPLCATIDDCKPDGSFPGITTFICGDGARKMSQLSSEERRTITCKTLARIFGAEELLHPEAYVDRDWATEPFTGGCYTSTYPPGVMTGYGSEIRKPHGRVYFAGTEAGTHWSGYMEGAVQSGERAAREILFAKGMIPESDIWQDEPESEDVPELPLELNIFHRYAPSSKEFLTRGIKLMFGCAAIYKLLQQKDHIMPTLAAWCESGMRRLASR